MILFVTEEKLEALIEEKIDSKLRTHLEPSPDPREAVAEAPHGAAVEWWMPRFLELLTRYGGAAKAWRALREEVPGAPCRATVYNARRRSVRFRREWHEALHGNGRR